MLTERVLRAKHERNERWNTAKLAIYYWEKLNDVMSREMQSKNEKWRKRAEVQVYDKITKIEKGERKRQK